MKISNTMKIKQKDGSFEDVKISYIEPNYCTAEGIDTVTFGSAAHAEGMASLSWNNNDAIIHTNIRNVYEYSNTDWESNLIFQLENITVPQYTNLYMLLTGAVITIPSIKVDPTTVLGTMAINEIISTSLLSSSEDQQTETYTIIFKVNHLIEDPEEIRSFYSADYIPCVIYNGGVSVFGSHSEGISTKASHAGAHAEGWETAAIGDSSHAEGYHSFAIGRNSHAEGSENFAIGESSHVEGGNCKTLNGYSHAEGINSRANHWGAHAEGDGAKAMGDSSHAEGDGVIAIGTASHAEGIDGIALGAFSHVGGGEWNSYSSIFLSGEANALTYKIERYDVNNPPIKGAVIQNSFHIYTNTITRAAVILDVNTNNNTITVSHTLSEEAFSNIEFYYSPSHSVALGASSFAHGVGVLAYDHYQSVIGSYNNIDWFGEYEFIIGHGTSYNRANAFTVSRSGDGAFAGTIKSNGADYAEYFEWEDKNILNEDRIGYLVSLNNNKIQKAQSKDSILGIISGTAGALGDNYEWEWKNKYLTDNFGRILYEEKEQFIDIPIFDKEGNKTIERKSLGMKKVPKLNPEYNPDEEYISRANRPEWDIVGLMGKLYLRDDGTCIPGEYAKVGTEPGIAAYSEEETKIYVMERINDNIIRVFLK